MKTGVFSFLLGVVAAVASLYAIFGSWGAEEKRMRVHNIKMARKVCIAPDEALVWWREAKVGVGVYVHLPDGAEPVYMGGMREGKATPEELDAAIKWLTALKQATVQHAY